VRSPDETPTVLFDDGAPSLPETECRTLLASANFGRLSVTIGALPVVVPVAYQYLGGSITLATGNGPASRAAHDAVVALGVDNAHLDDDFWTILVIGYANEITQDDERAELRTLDLAPPRGITSAHYLRLYPDLITGHRATPR